MNTEKTNAAKEFLIKRVIEQADNDGVYLSELEKVMLGFSEETATDADLEAAEAFDTEFDTDEYESKIVSLLRHAFEGDKALGLESQWKNSLNALQDEDFYLLVMVDQAGIE